MSSRTDILASIRANLPHLDRSLPAVPLFDADPLRIAGRRQYRGDRYAPELVSLRARNNRDAAVIRILECGADSRRAVGVWRAPAGGWRSRRDANRIP